MRRNRLLALAILAILGLAVLAPAGLASEAQPEGSAAAGRAGKRAERAAKREDAARRRAERRAQRVHRRAERQAGAEQRQAERKAALGHKSDPNADVEIDCLSITVKYHSFPDIEGSPNEIHQIVTIKSPPPPLLPVTFPPKTFTFEGSEATSVIPVAAPVGRSTVDIRSYWKTNGIRGGFDIHQTVICEPHPAFSIEKLQSLGGPFTTETLSGAVGQSIMYEILVTNTGNTPLTFTKFSDPVCDPGTIPGGLGTPIEPRETLTFVCVHKITAADLTAGKVVNVAKVTGTPEEGEGTLPPQESNRVEVAPITEEHKEGEKAPEGPKQPPGTPSGGVAGTSSANSGASSTSTSKSGVLGFASATVPSLRGPQGCVRGGFTAAIKSAGVSSVSFYLDGRLIRRLTSSSSHKGLLSVRIDVSKLKVGAHRVQARITMKASKGTKAVKATRGLTVVRCHSAVITPHFTG